MKSRYTLWSLLFVLASNRAVAQNFNELDLNNVRARFYSHGLVGHDLSNSSAACEVPNGSGANALFSAGLWIAGQSSDNQTKLAAMMYEASGAGDYYPGPLTTDGFASTTVDVMAQYDHVWSATSAQVALHTAYFSCLSDPDCDLANEFPNGYTIPLSFFDWPALDPNAGYETYLAPFFDFNADGAYDPGVGDAPCILGDQALFFVFNDKGGPHYLSGSQPIGIEVQTMPFAYASGDPFLEETVFVHYHLINRGTQTLTNTMIGIFNDFDLGCGEDDFVGTDATRNLTYAYNADDLDEDCLGAIGYGTQPPAFGMVVLKGPLLDYNAADDVVSDLLPAWNGTAFADGTIDNEKHGLSATMHINRDGPSCCNDPGIAAHFSNYLNGIWKDGTPQTYSGTGYSTDPNAVPAAFTYPADSDPVGAGTDGLVQSPWSETTIGNPDRRTVSSMGPITLEPGQHIDLLFAYVYARAASGGPLASVAALQARVDSVRAFASGLPLWNTPVEVFQGDCEGISTTGVEEARFTAGLSLFPIPASETVRFQAPSTLLGATLFLHDATGRIVLSQRMVSGLNEIDITSLANGGYTCAVTSAKARYTGGLIKE